MELIDPASEPPRIVLPMPPSANVYWRTSRAGITYVSAEAKEFKAAVFAQLFRGGHEFFTGRVALYAWLYRAQNSGDLLNREKVLCDAIQGLLYFDDKQICEAHLYEEADDKANPRIEIRLEARGYQPPRAEVERAMQATADARAAAKRKAIIRKEQLNVQAPAVRQADRKKQQNRLQFDGPFVKRPVKG